LPVHRIEIYIAKPLVQFRPIEAFSFPAYL